MGSSNSTASSPQPSASGDNSVKQCPVDHANISSNKAPRSCPVQHDNGAMSECPISAEDRKKWLEQHSKENIDPANMMPPPNQLPSPGQPFPLDTSREVSSIPRALDENNVKREEKWVYPSEQMFWNAMIRKGWRWNSEDISTNDMSNIIAIHNANNELAWKEVLKWEAMHAKECPDPRLKKFGGKAKRILSSSSSPALAGV
jgi:cytochrome c heme-lyase